MSALEQSFKDFAETHGLCHFAVSFNKYSSGEYFSAVAQWIDPQKPTGRGCCISNGDTLAESIASLAASMAEERNPHLADEALPELQ